MEEKIKTLGTLYANHFSARLDVVRLRTGRLTERIKIDHPEAAAVVAGKADDGEDTQVCAHRELIEETGYEAARLIPIFSYYPAIGYSNEIIRIYAASGLKRVSEENDEDEISHVAEVEWKHVQDLILRGIIQDGKTVIGISLFGTRMERGEIPKDFFK